MDSNYPCYRSYVLRLTRHSPRSYDMSDVGKTVDFTSRPTRGFLRLRQGVRCDATIVEIVYHTDRAQSFRRPFLPKLV